MPILVYRINTLLSRLVKNTPQGTNLGLFHLLWMILSGRLLSSRGALIPGLAEVGLGADAVRRAWAALAYGRWDSAHLLETWQQSVSREGCWQAHRHGGYTPLVCDFTRARAGTRLLPSAPAGVSEQALLLSSRQGAASHRLRSAGAGRFGKRAALARSRCL